MKYLAWLGGILASFLAIIYVVAFTSFGNNLLKPIIESKIKNQTNLESELKTFRLSHNEFEILLELNNNNSLHVEGTYSLFTQSFDAKYSVNLEELNTLEALTKTPLNDSFHTEGTVVGDMAFLKVDGKSDIAASATTYHVELTDLNPTSIIAKIDNADLKSLLYMLNQKEYASAKINLDMNFKNITPHKLDGNILLATKNGKLNPKIMKNDFNITIPATEFEMNLNAQLEGDDVDYVYMLNSNLASLSSSGKVTPEPLAVDIKYGVDVKELAVLKPITNADVRGALKLSGTVKGNKAQMLVDGRSDFASSDTIFNAILKDFEPASVKASIKHMKLQDVLYMVKQPKYADALISLEANILDAKAGQLKGDVDLKLSDGLLNPSAMKKNFNVTIPATNFNMNLKAKLAGADVDYTYILNSNLASLSSSGKVTPEPLKVDIKYGVDVKELAVLKPITNADIRGALKLSGTAKGNKAQMFVDGRSDFASSDTTFNAILKDFEPASVQASIKHMKLQDVLYMVKQPHYADALFSLHVDIADARSGKLKGVLKSEITNGVVDSEYMTKAYKFKTMMPRTTFSAKTKTDLHVDKADTELNFISNLANFDIKQARFNVTDGSLVSDYLVKVHDLNALFFATDRKLKGSIWANGELKKAKDLDFTLLSKVAGGKLNVKLHNDDFVANIEGMQTLEVLDMLIYPQIFKSSINGLVNYNLLTQKGDFKGNLADGKFTKNQVLDLAKKYANTDLYQEIFVGDVSAKINKENIDAKLDLKSNRSYIKTQNTKLNSKTKQIDSKLDISANGNPLIITLSGDVNAPKVGIDASKLIQKEAEKAITNEVNKLFKGLF